MRVTEVYSAIRKYINKRTVQGGALALAGIILFTGAVSCVPCVETNTLGLAEVEAARTAGIISVVSMMEAEAEEAVVLEKENSDVTMVAATTDEVEAEDVQDEAYDEWNDKVMAEVKDYLSIRTEANKDSSVVGKLRAGDIATLVDVFDGWYEIESGNAHGFVSADYCVTGLEAYELALDVCPTYATTTTGGLRIRKEASQDSKILKAVPEGTKLIVNSDAETVEGWVAVTSAGTSGYVSADYVDIDMETGVAITIEEEEAAKKAAAEAAAKAKAAAEAAAAANKAVIDNAGDLMLLAALIQVEAGGECYEGQVAVGSVVMNRVRSGSYPNSVYSVIYARGQFSTGRIVSILSKGPKSSCVQAAQAALNGSDSTGGATHFRRAGSTAGLVIGNHVFY